MPLFDLFVDEKVTVWMRQRVEVEAATIQEAALKLAADTCVDVVSSWNYLLETTTNLDPLENGGQETRVILSAERAEDGSELTLWSNVEIPQTSGCLSGCSQESRSPVH